MIVLVIFVLLLIVFGIFKIGGLSKDKMSNEELINLAMEKYRVEDRDVVLTSTPSENATNEEIRNASDIQIWDGEYIKIGIHTEINNDNIFDRSETYYELYKLVDGELEVFTETAAENVKDSEPDFIEKNDGVLDITKCVICN